MAGAWEPSDSRPIVEYAQSEIELFPPMSRIGAFDVSSSRHFIDPLNSLDDERFREVNVLKPLRSGGSLIGDIWLWSTIPDNRKPGAFMQVFQTEPEARGHAETRTLRGISGNRCTRDLLPFKYEWHTVQLTNGHTLWTFGPALSRLQSKPVVNLRLTECWMYPPGVMGEAEGRIGDALKQGKSKIYRESQGGPNIGKPLSECEWFRAWNRCAVHEWEVQCLHCQGLYQPIFNGTREDGTFWGIMWDKIKLPNGDYDIPKCIETVRFECPHCCKPVVNNDHAKTEWNRTGRYKAMPSDWKDRKGYHWETVIDFPWRDLVLLWLDAENAFRRGDLKPKLQFYQKRRAMFMDEETLLRGGMNFKRVAYEINSAWPDEAGRCLVVDRQEEDMFWWKVQAWAKSGKSRKLGFGKCYGFAAIEKIREDFKVQPNHTMIDSAYAAKGDHGVYMACIRYGWTAIRGSNEYEFIHRIKKGSGYRAVRRSYSPVTYADPGMGTSGEGKKLCPLIIFSKPQFNQLVQQRLDSGAMEEPLSGLDPEMEKEYGMQMAARVKRTEYDSKTNQLKTFWYEGKNDHARDLANHDNLFGVLMEYIPDPAEIRLAPSEEKQNEPTT